MTITIKPARVTMTLSVSKFLYMFVAVFVWMCGCAWDFFFTGTLNVYLRVRSIASVDRAMWTKSGHQGPDWKKAFFDVTPSGPFQVRPF